MKANQLMIIRTTGLLVGAALALASVGAAQESFPVFGSNYIKLSASGYSTDGNGAAFQRYTQNAQSGTAGIEDFNYNYDLSKDLSLEVNGKVLPGNANYLADFKLSKQDFGTIEMGYKTFRTFYDDIGGFFPMNNIWLPLNKQPLYVDRGKFFVDATLTLPKAPVFEFKYSNETRNGTKDTTIWGDTDLTGVPYNLPTTKNFIPAGRKILPAFIQLGERQETWEASMRQTVANTNILVTVGGDRINNLDSRQMDRNIGELKPYPFPTSGLLANNLVTSPTIGFDTQAYKETGYNVGGKVDTAITDSITVYAGVDFRHVTANIAAWRLLTNPIVTAKGVLYPIGTFTNNGRSVYSYTSTGNVAQDIVAGNVGVQFKPVPDLSIDAALRGENYKDNGTNNATYVATYVAQNTGASNVQTYAAPQSLDNHETPWTPAVDVRYTGIRTVALYGSWDLRTTTQDEKNGYSSIGPAGALQAITFTASEDQIKEHHQNVKLGANWTPVAAFNGRAEVFTKDHENRFTSVDQASIGDFYNLNYDIKGVKLTGIVHVLPTLSFTTRYIAQRGKAKVQDTLGSIQAGDSRTSTFAETIDWNPNKSVYVQANANFVYDTIITSYPQTTGLAQTVVHNADNNYWNGNVVAGFAVASNADFQLQGTYYKATNWQPAMATFALPYGAGEREYTVTAGIKYKLDAKTVICGKVGYVEETNDTTGGFTNFRGPVGYVSIERAF